MRLEAYDRYIEELLLEEELKNLEERELIQGRLVDVIASTEGKEKWEVREDYSFF